MSLGITGESCQSQDVFACTAEAEYCATLTDSHGEVVAHQFLCETHSQTMFALNVDKLSRRIASKGETLDEKVEDVRRKQERADGD